MHGWPAFYNHALSFAPSTSPEQARMTPTPSRQDSHWSWIFLAWLTALSATLGALFLGEVMGVAPCVLCWYQRIAMFPLVLILALGLLPFDARCVRYALPLAAAGWVVALYHCLLYWGVVPKDLVPCGEGASCTDIKAQLFSFVSVPLLSLIAFSVILVLLLRVKKELSQ